MIKMKDDYLGNLYRWLFSLGGLGTIMVLTAQPVPSATSFAAGVAAIAFLLSMWHITIDIGFMATTPKLAWMVLLMLLRYALIGILIYVIIRVLGRKIAISWPWFMVGTATLLPSLLLNDIFARSGKKPNSS